MSNIWLSRSNTDSGRYEEVLMGSSAYQNADSLFEVGDKKNYKTINAALTAAKAWRQAKLGDGGVGARVQALIVVYSGQYNENIEIADGININGVGATQGEVLVNGVIKPEAGQSGSALVSNLTILAEVDERTDQATYFYYSDEFTDDFELSFYKCSFLQKHETSLAPNQKVFFQVRNSKLRIKDCFTNIRLDGLDGVDPTVEDVSIINVTGGAVDLYNSRFEISTLSLDIDISFIKEQTISEVQVHDCQVNLEVDTARFSGVLSFFYSVTNTDKEDDLTNVEISENSVTLKINSDLTEVQPAELYAIRLLGTGMNKVDRLYHGLGGVDVSIQGNYQKAFVLYSSAVHHNVSSSNDTIKKHYPPYHPVTGTHLDNVDYHILSHGNVYCSGFIEAANYKIDGIFIKALPIVTFAGTYEFTQADVGIIEKTITFNLPNQFSGMTPRSVFVTVENSTDSLAAGGPDENLVFLTASVSDITTSSFTARFSSRIPELDSNEDDPADQLPLDPGFKLHYIVDLSGVTNFDYTFAICPALTILDVSNWDVSNVTTLFATFHTCSSLATLDVSNWNVSSVTDLGYTFKNCSSLTTLDVDLWDINQVTGFTEFAILVTIPTADYDDILIAWEAQAPQSGKSINFGNSQYTAGGAAEAARTSLINTYGWTITDGGAAP